MILVLCSTHRETVSHLLFECSVARQVFRKMMTTVGLIPDSYLMDDWMHMFEL